MTPEIIARVDRWLASRKEWLLATEYRDWMHYEWANAVDRYRSHERGDRREAVAAALSGLLLALVREAWGGASVDIVFAQAGPRHDDVHEATVSIYRGDGDRGRNFCRPGATAEEATGLALLSALDGAKRALESGGASEKRPKDDE